MSGLGPQAPKRVKAAEASKPQCGRRRATTVAPKASSASANVCGSGTEAATSPGRTATAYNALTLAVSPWMPGLLPKNHAELGFTANEVLDQ